SEFGIIQAARAKAQIDAVCRKKEAKAGPKLPHMYTIRFNKLKMHNMTITSISVDGTYIRKDGNVYNLTEQSILDNDDLLNQTNLTFDSEQDISASLNTANSIFIRTGAVVYPNGEVSLFLYLPCIVEYRNNIGKSRSYGTGDRTWQTNYLGTYASVGIGENVLAWLADRIDDEIEDASMRPPWEDERTTKIRMHDGHAWMN
ncbi:hypothetical protein BVRB_030550, partial [Beta vulgaris subsp. vulgaris]